MKSVITLTGNETWTDDLKKRLLKIPGSKITRESKEHPKILIVDTILSEPDVRKALLTPNFNLRILTEKDLPF